MSSGDIGRAFAEADTGVRYGRGLPRPRTSNGYDHGHKTGLLRFLDSRVFNPILRAKKEDYKESDLKALTDVQGSTKGEKKRFHSYHSAQEVRANYMSDLHSETTKRINKELCRLKLPRLPDVKDEFLDIADDRNREAGKNQIRRRRLAGEQEY